MLNEKLAEMALLRDSGLFDPEYLARAIGVDLTKAASVPVEFMYLESRDYWGAATSALFNGRYYLDSNPDLVASDVNPLLHYVTHGFFEGRAPCVLFDMDYILEQIQPGSSGWDLERKREQFRRFRGLRHMLQCTDVDPGPFFENAVYRQSEGRSGVNSEDIPLERYLNVRGRCEAGYLECSSLASMAYYMSNNLDLEQANVVPLLHLIQYGLAEGRRFAPDERVSAQFLRNSAHLSGNDAFRSVKGFLAHTRGTGRIAGPAWPTPYARDSLPSLRHRAHERRRDAFIGIVLYNNSEDELRRLDASLRNEVRISDGYRIDWMYYVNDTENLPRYRKVLGDRIIFDENCANVGFGRAHNELMRRCFDTDRLYIGANPDGYFTPGCIKALVDFSDFHGDQALIEGSAAPIDHPKWHDPVTLDTAWVSGACFALPYKLWTQVGGFDEKIHMYCEDVDLSWRVRLIGGYLKVCPAARFVHDVTPRFIGDKASTTERSRQQSMLAGGYYLARKWGGDEQAQRLREEFGRLVGRDNLHLLEEPVFEMDRKIARKVADFSLPRFAPSRFWN